MIELLKKNSDKYDSCHLLIKEQVCILKFIFETNILLLIYFELQYFNLVNSGRK